MSGEKNCSGESSLWIALIFHWTVTEIFALSISNVILDMRWTTFFFLRKAHWLISILISVVFTGLYYFCVHGSASWFPGLVCIRWYSIFVNELFLRAEDSSLYEELKQAYAEHIPLHLAQLKVLDESKVWWSFTYKMSKWPERSLALGWN